jgi:hypothetical protein
VDEMMIYEKMKKYYNNNNNNDCKYYWFHWLLLSFMPLEFFNRFENFEEKLPKIPKQSE